MASRAEAALLDPVLLGREGVLERAVRRWSGLAYGAALAFVAMLYANPMYWWPGFERLRLGFVTMAACAAAVLGRRAVSGERLRLGGAGSLLLLAYLAFIPLSLSWTIDPPATRLALVDAVKMAVVFVALQNALDLPSRLRRFLLVGALVSLGPALGGVWVWLNDDRLVEGYRTHWRGLYADPNRLAMSLVAVLPFALYGVFRARRRAARALFAGVVAAQVAAIVLTHSRSGAVAAVVATLLFEGRLEFWEVALIGNSRRKRRRPGEETTEERSWRQVRHPAQSMNTSLDSPLMCKRFCSLYDRR